MEPGSQQGELLGLYRPLPIARKSLTGSEASCYSRDMSPTPQAQLCWEWRVPLSSSNNEASFSLLVCGLYARHPITTTTTSLSPTTRCEAGLGG